MPTTTPTPDPQSAQEQQALIEELRHLAPSEDILLALRAAVRATRQYAAPWGPEAPGEASRRPADTRTAITAALEGALIGPAFANLQKSLVAVAGAMADTPAAVSPELSMSLQATVNTWQAIERECPLVSSTEVASILGSKKGNRNLASEWRAAGKILGVKRANAYRYPLCQFDVQRSVVLPVIPEIISVARKNTWSDEDVVVWLFVATAYFPEEDRPIDHLRDDPNRVLAAARDEFEGAW